MDATSVHGRSYALVGQAEDRASDSKLWEEANRMDGGGGVDTGGQIARDELRKPISLCLLSHVPQSPVGSGSVMYLRKSFKLQTVCGERLIACAERSHHVRSRKQVRYLPIRTDRVLH